MGLCELTRDPSRACRSLLSSDCDCVQGDPSRACRSLLSSDCDCVQGDTSRACRSLLSSDCDCVQGDTWRGLSEMSWRRNTPQVRASAGDAGGRPPRPNACGAKE